ncbi:MAG: hypothetical protein JWN81_850 [Solirubrobacterales bacterium]|nr:hypothetical protein [Solirubrobacterales bacterium]
MTFIYSQQGRHDSQCSHRNPATAPPTRTATARAHRRRPGAPGRRLRRIGQQLDSGVGLAAAGRARQRSGCAGAGRQAGTEDSHPQHCAKHNRSGSASEGTGSRIERRSGALGSEGRGPRTESRGPRSENSHARTQGRDARTQGRDARTESRPAALGKLGNPPGQRWRPGRRQQRRPQRRRWQYLALRYACGGQAPPRRCSWAQPLSLSSPLRRAPPGHAARAGSHGPNPLAAHRPAGSARRPHHAARRCSIRPVGSQSPVTGERFPSPNETVMAATGHISTSPRARGRRAFADGRFFASHATGVRATAACARLRPLKICASCTREAHA